LVDASVAIVGAGSIGTGWAIAFASAGLPVRLYDTDAGRLLGALAEMRARLRDLASFELLAEPVETVVVRIAPVNDLAAALAGATHVQECVPERLELKRDLFAILDELAPPGCPLASSSSFIPASRIAAGLRGQERCLVVHPGNPPYLLRVAEVVPAPFTSPAVVDRVERLLASAGLATVRVGKEVEGFVFNRPRVQYCARPTGSSATASPRWPRSIRWCVTGWGCAGR
jgi:L-gulonate 3-dehydrogenase